MIDERAPSSQREFVRSPDQSIEDFEKPVLHYTTEIDPELAPGIEQNPLIEALEVLQRADELAENRDIDAMKPILADLEEYTKYVWFDIETIQLLRDSINEGWENNPDISPELSRLGHRYARQLTRGERYLHYLSEQTDGVESG
jgi:hypothetical protein